MAFQEDSTNRGVTFACSLLQKIGADKSIVFAPLSILTALKLALLGAKNNTAREIQDAMAIGDPFDGTGIYEEIGKHGIKTANKIYFAENLQISDIYKNKIQKLCAGSFEMINFGHTDVVANNINQFVAKSTDNEIQNFVTPDIFSKDSQMVLINAIILEAKWKDKFEMIPAPCTFFSYPGKKEKISMIQAEIACITYSNEAFTYFKIPYQNVSFNMHILLPHERYGLSDVLETLNGSTLLNLMRMNDCKTGRIIIPRFELKSSFDLCEVLQKLNINDAFNQMKADFSGISTRKGIHISHVIHQAAIKVNEFGTKAAAATAIHKIYMTKRLYDFEICADHPFLYLIADQENQIFFMGTFYK